MGPNRVITNRRGYLTETVFDEETGRFEERPWPAADYGFLPAAEVEAAADDTSPQAAE